jgi:glycosyltransferase involved in cell wall biosynthesis
VTLCRPSISLNSSFILSNQRTVLFIVRRMSLPINCIHVNPGIAHEASGPSYSVPRLCEELGACGVNVQLWISDRRPTKVYSFPVRWFPPIGPFKYRLGRCPLMHNALEVTMPTTQILHNHSLWMMSNVYPGIVIKNTRCKLITSPRGTLSAWALRRRSFRKKLLLLFGQRHALYRATCLHATSEAEYRDIRAYGLKQPVAIIPNGFDLPQLAKLSNRISTKKRLLFLGRIHPVKGLDQLVEAWKEIALRLPDWELHIVGPGEPEHLKQLQKQISGNRSIQMRDAIYGDEKSDEYQQATAYILPSHSENFAMTVAEALAHRLPCIVSQGAPWSGLETKQCGWWIKNDKATLANTILKMANTHSSDLTRMGERGRSWIEDDFGWHSISMKMHKVYEWMLNPAKTNDTLRFN